MEHRCGERIAMRLPVTLRRRGEATPGILLNLSCGGAFVAMHAGTAPLRGLVEIELRLPYETPRACRWRAFVVHQHPDGVGLMFDELQLGELLPLLALRVGARKAQERVAWAAS